MKVKILLSIALSGFLINSTAFAGRCIFEGNPVSVSQIEKAVQTLGYTIKPDKWGKSIKYGQAIKLEDCVYHIKVDDKSGQKWTLHFDPLTGKLIGKS